MTAIKCEADRGGPYKAVDTFGTMGWWYVADRFGFNVLRYADRPGACFTGKDEAEAIAREWNEVEKKPGPQAWICTHRDGRVHHYSVIDGWTLDVVSP